jgi:hypothetical protein
LETLAVFHVIYGVLLGINVGLCLLELGVRCGVSFGRGFLSGGFNFNISGGLMKISSFEIDKTAFIVSVILVALIVAGCIWWSWAILVGAILGCLFGMMWGFHEVNDSKD